MIRDAVRRGTLSLDLTPVFLGSAYKNKAVQPLLDAVTAYLPSPLDIKNTALDLEQDEKEVILSASEDDPLACLAFKLEDGRYGQLTYIRIYQGLLKKGATLINSRNGRKVKVGRLVRMHADEMEDIVEAPPGDIVALFGVECASGDTFTAPSVSLSMTSMHVPAPVISLAVQPKDHQAQDNMGKALNRFSKEDPTFRTHLDAETGETIISGMGELHLEVYLERMRREYGADVEAGAPQVAYRETITRRSEFNYTHKKQTGGAGQFGRVAGYMEPLEDGEYEFVSEITGGAIPTEYIPSLDKGFRQCLKKGSLAGFPLTGVRLVVNDGASHSVDSSDNAFQAAAVGAFREVYPKSKPVLLEPIMKVAVEGPSEFQGAIMGGLSQRRGIISGTYEEGTYTVVEAEVPLAEMFGYSTVLRSATQGKAEFTMEFSSYRALPKSLTEEVIKKADEKRNSSAA
jgi:elongation factor G